MGLFDLFSHGKRGKQEPKKTKQEESLAVYHGMRVEVMSEEGNELLFTARMIVVLEEGVVELQMLSDPTEEIAEEPWTVRMRGFEASQGMAVHMKATIQQQRTDNWRVKGLQILGKDNDRAFFRQATEIDGMVRRMQSDDEGAYECVVRNISAGGVCFQTGKLFRIGDILMLRAQLLPGQKMAPLLCQVRRITPRRGGYYYGCQFYNLDSVAESQISKAIIQLQMERLKR